MGEPESLAINSVIAYARDHRGRFLEELCEYLKFKSVSADSAFKQDVLACADHTAILMRNCGLQDVEVFETQGYPVVFGQTVQHANRPTILVYGHYDVQPPDPLDLWESPPFDPQIRGDYLYARGVSDDKGQIYCHLKAIESWMKTVGDLPVNVKVIIEGEEEIGSPSFLAFLKSKMSLLQADIALVSDTPMLGKGQPSICTSLRGLLYVEITARATAGDLHSGQHGGAVPNAIHGLMQALNALKDESGRVTIPGFYDDVVSLTADQRKDVANLPHDDTAYMASIGASALVGEKGYTTLERRWYRPTLDINGVWGGYIGEGSKTVIPSLAHAKFSMRLVANQNPNIILDALKQYLTKIAPPGITLSLDVRSEAAFPAAVSPDHPAVRSGLNALQKAFAAVPVLQGEGGTIPVVADFKNILGIPTVLMGFNLPDDCIHAPNERFALEHFYKGIEASAWFFDFIVKQ